MNRDDTSVMMMISTRFVLGALVLATGAAGLLASVGCSDGDGTAPANPDDASAEDGGATQNGEGGITDAGAPEIGPADSGPADSGPADGAIDADAAAPSDPSAGCGTSATPYPAGTTEATLAFGGKSRTFRVHVPPSYQPGKPTPVVLLFHGGGGSGEQLQTGAGGANMDAIADRDGFITVYPYGTGVVRTWNGGTCCGKAAEDNVDDVGFVAALLDHLEAGLCLDRLRIFSTGMSNGAILSHRLACELSGRIAAVAPVAATIALANCQPSRPVPVMQIQGTLDGHVPWDGGVGCGPSDASFTSVPATMEGWRVRNGCSATTAPFFSEGNGACTVYDGCQAPVVLCAINGGGHSWPGGAPKGGGVSDCPGDGAQSTTFFASEAAWQFFKANPKRP